MSFLFFFLSNHNLILDKLLVSCMNVCLVHFGPASICHSFGLRSCIFYSSLVLPFMNHLLCNPVVMSCVSLDLDSVYGSPGSNSMKKIILACCSSLTGAPDGCHVPPQDNTVRCKMRATHWKLSKINLPKRYSLRCPQWRPSPIRYSKHHETNAKNYLCLFDWMQSIIPQIYPSRWNEGLITASLPCKMITVFCFFFFWLFFHHTGSNWTAFF